MFRFFEPIAAYLLESEHNLLGFRVAQHHEPIPRQPRQIERPKVILAPEKPFIPSVPAVKEEPPVFEQLQTIEQRLQQDLFLAQRIPDGEMRDSVVQSCWNKYYHGIARLIHS